MTQSRVICLNILGAIALLFDSLHCDTNGQSNCTHCHPEFSAIFVTAVLDRSMLTMSDGRHLIYVA